MYFLTLAILFLSEIGTNSSCEQGQQNMQAAQSQTQIGQAADLITGAMMNMKAPNKCSKPASYDCTNECEQKPPAEPSNALADAVATMVPQQKKPGQKSNGGGQRSKELECITGKKQDCTSQSRGSAETALFSVLAQTSKDMENFQNQKKDCEKVKEQEQSCSKPSAGPFGNTCETAQQLREMLETTPIQPQKQPPCKPPISPQVMDIMNPPQGACEQACQKPDPAASAPAETMSVPKAFKYRNPPSMPDFTLSARGKPQCVGTATTLSTEFGPSPSECSTESAKPTRPAPLKECDSGPNEGDGPAPTSDCGSGGQSLSAPFSAAPTDDCGSSAMPSSSPMSMPSSSPSADCGSSAMPSSSPMPNSSPPADCGSSAMPSSSPMSMPSSSPPADCGSSGMPGGTPSPEAEPSPQQAAPQMECGANSSPQQAAPQMECGANSSPQQAAPQMECGTMPETSLPTTMAPTLPQPAAPTEPSVTDVTFEPPEPQQPCNPQTQAQTPEPIPQINVQELLAQTEKQLACHQYMPTAPPPIKKKAAPAPAPSPSSDNQMNIPGLANLSNVQKMCCGSQGECPCVPIINVYPVIYK